MLSRIILDAETKTHFAHVRSFLITNNYNYKLLILV